MCLLASCWLCWLSWWLLWFLAFFFLALLASLALLLLLLGFVGFCPHCWFGGFVGLLAWSAWSSASWFLVIMACGRWLSQHLYEPQRFVLGIFSKLWQPARLTGLFMKKGRRTDTGLL